MSAGPPGDGDDWAKAGKRLEFAFPTSGDLGLVDTADEEEEDPAGLAMRDEDEADSEDALESHSPALEFALERLAIRGVSQRLFALPEPRRRKLPPLFIGEEKIQLIQRATCNSIEVLWVLKPYVSQNRN